LRSVEKVEIVKRTIPSHHFFFNIKWPATEHLIADQSRLIVLDFVIESRVESAGLLCPQLRCWNSQ
jgi:hypothetical protein